MSVTIAVVLPFFPITVASMAMTVVSVVVASTWVVISLIIVVSLVRVVLSLIVSLIKILSLVWCAEQSTDCTCSTTHTSTDRTANYAAYRSRCTTTLVCALVGATLHSAEDALSMHLMRYGN